MELREPAQLALIKEASEQGRQLELHYYSASSDRESTRTVDPVAVRAIEGRWYLDGYCHNAQGMRRFRIDRVSSAQLTGRPAAAHDDTVPDANAGDAFVPGPEATVAHVAVDDAAVWIVEALPTSGVEPMGDGRTRVGIPVASTVWFGRLFAPPRPPRRGPRPARARRGGPRRGAPAPGPVPAGRHLTPAVGTVTHAYGRPIGAMRDCGRGDARRAAAGEESPPVGRRARDHDGRCDRRRGGDRRLVGGAGRAGATSCRHVAADSTHRGG